MNTELLYSQLEAAWRAEEEAQAYLAPISKAIFGVEAHDVGNGARDTILEMVREYDAAVTDEMLVGMIVMAEMFQSFADRDIVSNIPTDVALNAACGTLLGLAARLWKERQG